MGKFKRAEIRDIGSGRLMSCGGVLFEHSLGGSALIDPRDDKCKLSLPDIVAQLNAAVDMEEQLRKKDSEIEGLWQRRKQLNIDLDGRDARIKGLESQMNRFIDGTALKDAEENTQRKEHNEHLCHSISNQAVAAAQADKKIIELRAWITELEKRISTQMESIKDSMKDKVADKDLIYTLEKQRAYLSERVTGVEELVNKGAAKDARIAELERELKARERQADKLIEQMQELERENIPNLQLKRKIAELEKWADCNKVGRASAQRGKIVQGYINQEKTMLSTIAELEAKIEAQNYRHIDDKAHIEALGVEAEAKDAQIAELEGVNKILRRVFKCRNYGANLMEDCASCGAVQNEKPGKSIVPLKPDTVTEGSLKVWVCECKGCKIGEYSRECPRYIGRRRTVSITAEKGEPTKFRCNFCGTAWENILGVHECPNCGTKI